MPKPRTVKTPADRASSMTKDQRLNEGFRKLSSDRAALNKQQKALAKDQKALEASKKNAKDDADGAIKSAKDKNSMSYAALAALGIGTATAVAIIASGLADYVASDGAVISFTDISPQSSTASFVPSFFGQIFTPSKFEVTWEVKTVPPGGLKENVTIVKGNTVSFKDTGIKSIDGKTLAVLDVTSDNVFVVDSKMTDSSKEHSTTGTGVINTEYDQNLNDNIASATGIVSGGLLGAAGGIGDGLMKNIGTILFIVIIVFALYFGLQIVTSTAKSR